MKPKNINYIRLALMVLIIVGFCFFTGAKILDLPSSFTNLLTRSQMTFVKPDGLEEIPVIKNKQMHYEYAIKLPGHNLEVRYAITPLDTLLIQYEAMKKNQQAGITTSGISPNKFYLGAFHNILSNISGGHVGNFNQFPPDAVKREFNADWGATAMVPLEKEFGQDYKNCLVVALHKDNVADAYYFYLLNGAEDTKLLPTIFHALKFK